ncbi:AarF/UbiB family protein [Kitasatospora sp. NBC_01302]|uniref:AarF/UbiB family protein n=1 Tax=Kitasatospora sp. NBC_01302 TaxID=2903575 RepID=UPI002E0F95D4|nr:AarF/UbiB family protein [Kitasatospora sp. NBC_01302]
MRYQEISDYLSSFSMDELSQQWKMEFEYLPQGVKVDEFWYPALKMEWVEGETLLQWLEANYQDRKSIRAAIGRFKDLMRELATAGVAHGDLQHGNILVAPDGTLRLVDYDGLYVPALSGMPGAESGHRNYQSPLRGVEDFGPGIDNFSAWVIYLSLSAVAADPSLWVQLHEPDSEHLLLERADFDAPGSSARFLTLLQHPDSRIRELAEAVISMVDRPLAELPGLDQGVVPGKVDSAGGGISDDGDGPSRSGRPAWLQSHLSVMAGHVRAPVRSGRTFRRRRAGDVALAASAVSFALLVSILGMTGTWDVGLVSIAELGVGGLSAGAAVLGWRSRVEVREMLRDSHIVSQLLSRIGDPGADHAQLATERERCEEEESRRITLFTDDQRVLTQHLQKEYARIESEMRETMALVKAEQVQLSGARQAAIDKAAEPFQRSWVEIQLQQFEISRSYLAIGGDKVFRALVEAGIRTAADFTGAIEGEKRALLVRSDGKSVRVPGVGAQRAAELRKWRERRMSELIRQCPIGLPEQMVREVEDSFAPRFRALDGRQRDAETAACAARDGVTVRIGRERANLVELNKPAVDAAHATREDLDRRATQLRSRVIELQALKRESHILEGQRRALSLWSYIRFLFPSGVDIECLSRSVQSLGDCVDKRWPQRLLAGERRPTGPPEAGYATVMVMIGPGLLG